MNISPFFMEKIILLVLTALITGFGVPCILKWIDARKLREQKKFEADLSRQEKIIEAQSKLLDDLTQLLWKWRYLAKKVVYYGCQESEGQERYDLARKEYDESSWDILQEFRAVISRSRRLASESSYESLNSLYGYIVGDIDRKVSKMIETQKPNLEESKKMSRRFSEEVSKRLDDAINDLASELKLKVKA